jgi:hypothetical protein
MKRNKKCHSVTNGWSSEDLRPLHFWNKELDRDTACKAVVDFIEQKRGNAKERVVGSGQMAQKS